MDLKQYMERLLVMMKMMEVKGYLFQLTAAIWSIYFLGYVSYQPFVGKIPKDCAGQQTVTEKKYSYRVSPCRFLPNILDVPDPPRLTLSRQNSVQATDFCSHRTGERAHGTSEQTTDADEQLLEYSPPKDSRECHKARGLDCSKDSHRELTLSAVLLLPLPARFSRCSRCGPGKE
uniref:Uncharacterized protein n=1 Tax=Anopheles atroparvus TaxID=41427 RepID=A0A182JIK2_ANOAO